MRLAVLPLGALLLLSACAADPFLEEGKRRNQEISERVTRLAELRAICAGTPQVPGRGLTATEAQEQKAIIVRLQSLAPDIWPQVPLFHPRVEEMRNACAGDPDRQIPGRSMTQTESHEIFAILYPPTPNDSSVSGTISFSPTYGRNSWDREVWTEPAWRSDQSWDYSQGRYYNNGYYQPNSRDIDRERLERERRYQREQLEIQRRALDRMAAEREARREAEEVRRRIEEEDRRRARREAERNNGTHNEALEVLRRMEESRIRREQQEARDREDRARRQADDARRRADEDRNRQAQQEARDREDRARRQADDARRRAEEDRNRQAQQEARDRDDRARREADDARRRADEARRAVQERNLPSTVSPN